MSRTARTLLPFLALAALGALTPPRSPAAEPPAGRPGTVEVRFTDSSVVKVVIKDAKVELTTPYGKLAIPVGAIQRIEFATRLADDTAKRIEEAVANLAHPQFSKREAASAELLKLQEKGYPALLEAAKSKDSEVARRAEELLDRIRESVPADLLEVRKVDVIQTADSKFAGRIEGTVLNVVSAQFGERPVKLADMRSLRAPGVAGDEPVVVHAEPDPGSLTGYNDKIGQTFHFRVTGATTAIIWGTGTYTTDSQLATAAVHAGVLKPGQTGVVKVTIMASPPLFQGSTQNGVTSHPYGMYPASYKVGK
jgi:LCCL domain